MARPRIEIDQKIFENLCAIQCTQEEIAQTFGCSVDTISRWCNRVYKKGFAEVYKEKSVGGKVALRRMQLRLAEKNVAMAIWLGKQWLGQVDKVEEEVSNKVTVISDVPMIELNKENNNE